MMESIRRLLAMARKSLARPGFAAASRLACAALIMCLTLAAGLLIAFPADSAYAAADEYTYKITINAGKEGTFSNGKTVVMDSLHYGDEVTIDINSLGLTVNDPSTYYARGLKFSGHDNDEISNRDYQSFTFRVTGDEQFSVAYALNGTMVKYVINYIDADSRVALRDSETFYGMVGDFPVVSYKVIDGYLPDAYNKGRTLQADESVNVFNFEYSRTGDQGGQTTIITNPNDGNNGGNNGGVNNAGGNANQPADFVNLDDGETPMADPGSIGGGNGGGTTDIDDSDTPKGIFGTNPMLPILGLGLLAAVIALIAFLRTRGKDDDEEVADQLEDMYVNDPEGLAKLSQADCAKFETSDPDELKEAFKDLGKD